MKKTIVMAIVLVFGFASMAMAGGFDKCAACHNGKTSSDKAAILAKFKTADTMIKAAKDSKNPMMAAVKTNEADLKAAAADLGLK